MSKLLWAMEREIEKAINMHGKLNIISILTKVHLINIHI